MCDCVLLVDVHSKGFSVSGRSQEPWASCESDLADRAQPNIQFNLNVVNLSLGNPKCLKAEEQSPKFVIK